MRALRFALLALLRDWRSGELAVLLAALLVAVTALTGVGFFTDRIGQAVNLRAAEVLAADLRLQARPAARTRSTQKLAAERGIATATTVSFPSVVFFGEDSALTAVRAAGPGYPLRGRLKIADAPFAPGARDDGAPGARRGLARFAPAGAARRARRRSRQRRRHDLHGDARARLPARPGLGVRGPRAVAPDPARGSRCDETARPRQPRDVFAAVRGRAGGRSRKFKTELSKRRKPGERLVDVAEASPQIRSSTERAGRFLNLSALITVLLAAVAVAMAARRYTQRHLDNVALMKCMGAPQSLVLQVTVIELGLLALDRRSRRQRARFRSRRKCSTWLLGDLVRADLPPPTAAPAIMGAVTALAILVGFALPPMLQLKRVPPARVLRRNLEPPPLRYSVSYGLALAALLAVLYWLVRDGWLVGYVAAGVGGHARRALRRGLAAGAPRRAPARRGRRRLALWPREPRAPRPREHRAGGRLRARADGAAAARGRAQRPARGLAREPAGRHAELLHGQHPGRRDRGASRSSSSERGLPRAGPVPDDPRAPDRDQRQAGGRAGAADRSRAAASPSASRTCPGPKNRSRTTASSRAAGGPRPTAAADSSRSRREYQEDLGLKLGDKLTFDVAGETARGARSASFREVQWDTLPAELLPGLLARHAGRARRHLAHQHEARRRSSGQLLADLVRRFPSVSIFDIDAILAQVRDVMDRASLAVQYVFLFTLAAGITGAARRDPVDARRAPLRERDAAHARREPARGARRRRLGVHGARHAVGHARGARRDARRLAAREESLRPGVHARSLGLGDRARGGRRHRRRRGHLRRARRHQSSADQHAAARAEHGRDRPASASRELNLASANRSSSPRRV